MLRAMPMSHNKNWEAIRAEIARRNAAGESFEAISALMGAKKGGTLAFKINNGENKGQRTNADKIKRYMKGLSLPFDEGDVPADLLPTGFSLVRKVAAKLGAGSSLQTEDDTEGFYAFRDDFLTHLGMKAKPLLFEVLGDSMEPTLKSKDTVLIDKSEIDIHSGQLYAVGIGEELHIKRVFKQPDGSILLKSDNPAYPSWEIPKDERPRVIGRARWVGRML